LAHAWRDADRRAKHKSMKTADRFRATELLHAIRAERARVSIRAGELIVTPLLGDEVTRYAKSLCRELSELYREHPKEVGEMIAARQAA
jgi:hypothetical protein